MHGRIHNLRYHYRIIGAPGTANVLEARLNRLGKQQVAEACAEVLDQAMGDDPTVYVIRRVTSRLALTSKLTDEQIAQRWGRQMAKAIMQQLAGTDDHSTQVLRFESQAVYVAHFISDLLENRAWSRWYYTPFLTLQALPPQTALHAVLAEYHAQLPAILAALHRAHMLDTLLATLEPAAQQALWTNADDTDGVTSVSTLRSLFAAALHLAEQLQLGTLERSAAEALLTAYARRSPPIDWRDTRSLASAVFAVLRWLFERGDVFVRPSDTCWRANLSGALTKLDWLDTRWLQDALEELLSPNAVISPTLPVRSPAPGPTARQRQLCADLAAVLRAAGLWLDPQTPNSPANGLRLYAALLNHAPYWADDLLTNHVITQTLIVWEWAAREHVSTNALRLLQERSSLATSEAPARPQLPGQVASFLINFGEPGATVVELLAACARAQSESREVSISPSAGNTQGLPARQSQHSARSIGTHTLLDSWDTADPARPGMTQQLNDRPPSTDDSNKRQPSKYLRPPRDTTDRRGCDATLDAAALDRSNPPPPRAAFHPAPDAAALDRSGHTSARFTGQVLESQCAGVLLLLRALLDTKLPALISQVFANDHTITSAYLMGLGMCWAGQASVHADQIDPAVALLAGAMSVPELDQVRNDLARWTAEQHVQLQTALLRTLVGQRVVRGNVMQLYTIPFGKHCALIVGDETDGPLLFGSLLDAQSPSAALVTDWQARWEEVTGRRPACIADHMHLEASDEATGLNHTRSIALIAALNALEVAHLGLPIAELGLTLTALALLRAWACWLRQFSQSSVPYLLTNFIRRPGRLIVGADSVLVQVARGPLDIVLELSGYTAEIERLPWLGRRRFRYQLI